MTANNIGALSARIHLSNRPANSVTLDSYSGVTWRGLVWRGRVLMHGDSVLVRPGAPGVDPSEES
jgi:hypothetical protein